MVTISLFRGTQKIRDIVLRIVKVGLKNEKI